MHPDVYKRPLLLVLAALIVGLCFLYHPAPGKRDVFHFIPQKEVTLTGRVESFAVTKKDSQHVFLQVGSVNGQPAGGRVYARIKDFTPLWKDTLTLTGRLQRPYGISMPGNFDWRNYLAQKQTFTEIKSSRVEQVKPAAWPWRVVRAVRRDILRVFSENFPPQVAYIAGGILLGERGELDADLYTAFQDSGAVHLLVASGGNVGFVTLLTLGIGVLMGLRRRWLLVVALNTAGIYTLVAGADAPLLRAYLMATCACVGYFLGRNSGVFQGLILSCVIILLRSPSAVFETGFQMSFLATLAIVICLNNYRVPGTWPKTLRFFAQIFLATLASQLALLPIFTNVFYKVSLVGLLSNMILVPFASLLMALGFAYYLLTLVHAGILLYYPCLWGFEIFQYLVQFFASFRFSSLTATAWNGGSVAAYYLVLFWISQLPHRAFARKIAVPCLAGALLAWGIGYGSSSLPRACLFSEWDKRAVLVRLDKRTSILLNDGLDEEKLERALFAWGLRHTDLAISFDRAATFSAPWAHAHAEPFLDLWPGDTVPVGFGRIKAVWGIHQTKEGRLWEDTGYSGLRRGNISYCIEKDARTLCVGSEGRFVKLPSGKILPGKRNETVCARW